MSDLIRTDNIFGKRANIVGNISADLVLESLGKIYIKSRNSAKTLEEIIKSVALNDINTIGSRTKVIEDLENLDIESIKEGELIYDKLSNILYIWIDNEPIELINVAPDGTGYVKRSGDTMTGRLTINVESGPPLHVNSTELVPNLNANYLQGESAASFTRRTRDENITGRWAFKNVTEFHNNASFSKDIVLNGSIGTPYFASGFGGSGWRLDAETNTLTVDNLIVRKLMQVYELVVNKISATNGSLWVTNAGKVKYVLKLPVYTADLFVKDTQIAAASSLEAFVKSLLDKTYFVILPEASNGNTFMLKGADIMSSSGIMPAGKGRADEIERRYTASALANGYVVLIKDLESVATFTKEVITPVGQDSYDIFYYKLNTLFQRENPDSGYATHPLYDVNFKHNVELPIVTKDYYEAFKVSEEYRVIYENITAGMNSTDTKHIDDESIVNEPGDFTKALIKQALVTKAIGLAGIWPGSNTEFLNPASTDPEFITYIKSYYKYYQTGNYYLVTFDDDTLPVFKPGDLLRCLKWTHGGIKYYDAIVCNYIDNSSYILQVADLNFDVSTVVTYNDSLEPTTTKEQQAYNQGLTTTTNRINTGVLPENPTAEDIANAIIGIVEKEDSLVLMGNLWDAQRQNAVYITSVDDGAPYMDVLSGINRPDFSVNYYTPIYNTIKLYKKNKYENIGLTNLDIPYTGDYYVLDGSKTNSKAEFVLGDYTYNSTKYRVLVDLSLVSNVSNPIYLSTLPNDNTLFTGEHIYGGLLTEDDCIFISEDATSTLVREETYNNLRINASKTTKVRVGKLDGIRDDMFPIDKQPYGYGLYGSNVFLIGEFYLSNGRSLAEISLDAINFAIASESTMNNSINYVRLDLNLAKTTLERNVSALDLRVTDDYYTKSALKTAGMSVIDVQVTNNGTTRSYPSLALWGNHIMIATSQEELNGTAVPTAMFYKGRIRSKFLEIDEVHNTTPIENPDDTYTYNGFTGSNNIYRYTFYKSSGNSSEPYLKDCKYVREFLNSENKILFIAIVDLNGHIIFNSGAPLFPTLLTVTKELVVSDGGVYDKITNVTDTYTLDDEFFEDYYAANEGDDIYKAFANYNAEKIGLVPVLWSLEADGSGNLGGRSFVWDTEGNVTMKGTVYASSGKIGGFALEANKIYNKQTVLINQNSKYDTYFYLANDTTIPCVFLSNVKKNYNNSIINNNRLIMTADTFVMQTYKTTSAITDLLIANPLGLSWENNGFKAGALAILASITVIPIWCYGDEGGSLLHVKCLAADPVFNEIIVMAGLGGTANDQLGYSAIVFPLLDLLTGKSSYIAKGLSSGKINILVTSIPELKTTARFSYLKNYIMSDNYNPDFRSVNHNTVKSNIQSICFTKGLYEYGCAYTNKFESQYYIKTKLVRSGAGIGSYTFYSLPENDVDMHYNYIQIVSADDDSPNCGGYMLNIVANQYIEDTTSYEDPQTIIDNLNDLKTPLEIHLEYDDHYKQVLYKFNYVWNPFLSNLSNNPYSSLLYYLSEAINDCIEVSEDNSTNWELDNPTIILTQSDLDTNAESVEAIYLNEKAKERWEQTYDDEYATINSYDSYSLNSSYRNAKRKFDLFEAEIFSARQSNDYTSLNITTTYYNYIQAYREFYRLYVDENNLDIIIPSTD